MRTEQRAERAELEPAHVQLAGQLPSGDESASVSAPIGQTAQAGIDAHRDLEPQRFPSAVDVTGPDKRSVSLDSGGAVAVQRERPDIWTVHQRTIKVEAVTAKPRTHIEGVAFIGPPSIDPRLLHWPVLPPIAARFFRVRDAARIVNRAAQRALAIHDMQNNAEMLFMQMPDDL